MAQGTELAAGAEGWLSEPEWTKEGWPGVKVQSRAEYGSFRVGQDTVAWRGESEPSEEDRAMDCHPCPVCQGSLIKAVKPMHG